MSDQREKKENDLNRELRDHLELDAEARMDRGVSADEARYAAQRDFGNATLVKEVTREMWGWSLLERLLQDARYGLRVILRNPGFTAVAIAALALGIGANTAIFSVVSAVLFHPLPYRDAGRLVWVTDIIRQQKNSAINNTLVFDADYFAWRNQNRAFEDMAAYSTGGDNTLTGAGEPVSVRAGRVSASFLSVLGVDPQLGRTFRPDEDRPNATNVVLLSDSIWRQRFSSDPAVVGRAIALDGKPYMVTGVLPSGFEFMDNNRADVLVPLALEDREVQSGRAVYFVRVVGRLRMGVTLASAESDLDVVNGPLHASFPPRLGKLVVGAHAKVVTLRDHLVGSTRPALLVLLGAVGFVLLIACVNVANLQFGRALAREKEMAIRSALGADRLRLSLQLLTESVMLGLAGGGAGLLLALWLIGLVRHLGPQNIPHLESAGLDWRVLFFALTVSLITGLVSGSAPVVSAFRASLNDSLKEGGMQSGAGGKARRSQQFLMVTEIALALVLFIGAGLLARTFVRLISIPPGFDPHDVLTAELSLPRTVYKTPEQQHSFHEELLSRLQGLPGVTAAGGAAVLPLQGVLMTAGVAVEGRPSTAPDVENTHINIVTPGYFSALRIPLLAGRFLDRRDATGAPYSAVVNQTFAHRYFPNGDAVGSRIQFAGQPWCTIAGVVADFKQGLMTDIEPEIFTSDREGASHLTIVIRTAGDPTQLVPAVRAQIAAMDKSLPLYGVTTIEELLSGEVASQRFNAALLATFAGLALLLAAVGIYGVMAYSVGQRTHEIGIRMALGAVPGDVQRMMLALGLKLAFAGIALGLAASYGLTRLLHGMLYGVTPTDPATFAGGTIILVGVALAACWIPARRATRVDPLVALRYE